VAKATAKKNDDGNGEFGSIMQEAAPAYRTRGSETTANLSAFARAYLAHWESTTPTQIPAPQPALDARSRHRLLARLPRRKRRRHPPGLAPHPLPNSKAALLASAELGKHVAALLDTETPVDGSQPVNFNPN